MNIEEHGQKSNLQKNLSVNTLVLVMGLPGSGKTTFAKALSKHIKAVHLNSDIVRTQLDKRGQYDEQTKIMIYDQLCEQTYQTLKNGKTVIVDATFYKQVLRNRFIDIAIKLVVPYKLIKIKAQPHTIKKRMNIDREHSEADFSVYQSIKEQFEPIEEPFLAISSEELSLEEMTQYAQQYINESA